MNSSYTHTTFREYLHNKTKGGLAKSMLLKHLKQIERIVIFFALFATTLGTIGGQWDLSMHIKQGHEFFAPPHLMIAGQLMLLSAAGVFAAISIVVNKRALGTKEKRGLCLSIFGGALIPLALTFDELWHRLIGLDQTAWSAPHALLFLGVASVLFGLLIYKSSREEQKSSLWLSPRDSISLLFFVAILLLGMFTILDFENPHISERIKDSRPGFTYAISVSGINILAMLLAALAIRKVGAATIAALIAWSFHATVAFAIATIGGFWHMALPFPIIIPALLIDVWLYFLLRNADGEIYTRKFSRGVFISAVVSYGSVIAWALFYSKLPQQAPTNPDQMILGALLLIPLSIGVALIARCMAKYFLKNPA